MRIKAIVRGVVGVFVDQLQLAIKLRHAARSMAHRAPHHGDQEAALGQGVELVGNRRKRRVSSGKELWCAWIGNVPEKDFLLSFEDAKQAAARGNLSVR